MSSVTEPGFKNKQLDKAEKSLNAATFAGKKDKRISNAPYSAIKYNQASGDIMLMGWNDRADLEYYLLNYDVEKNSATGANAENLRKFISMRNLTDIVDFKKDGFFGGLSKIQNLILSLFIFGCIICLLVSLIVLVILTLLKMTYYTKPFKNYIAAFILSVLILCVIIYFFNKCFLRIIFTQETL